MFESEASDVIPCWARILHHIIMLIVQLQNKSMLLPPDFDPHDIEDRDVPIIFQKN